MKLTRRSLLQALGSLVALPSIGVAAVSFEQQGSELTMQRFSASGDWIAPPDYGEFIYTIQDGDEFEAGLGTYDPETQTLHRLT